ncbi:MAG TPA: hypothetical protein VJA18_07415 [Candidatus Nanoarchaeia archaeon]|nr:hypothetical protein [Candidatus Nanoarchaeia archaeon]
MADKDLPLITLPPQSGEYKVVQFDNGSQPYLRFAKKPQDDDFHRFILSRFAREIEAQCIEIPGPDDLIPALPDNIPYRMVGAGRCDINLEAKTASFCKRSHDYRIGINQDHLQRLRIQLPDWQIK